MNPAKKIIKTFGGVSNLSSLLNVNRNMVYKWAYPKSKGGTDGHIPTRYQGRILKIAGQMNIPITAEDLIK